MEERVRQDVLQAWTLVRIIVEDAGDEVNGRVRDGDVLWELVGIVLDALVDLLDLFGLKRRLANEKGVENDTDGPDVDFEGVAVVAVKEDLGGNVVGCAADGFLALAREANESSETKVADLEIHVAVKEEVAKLEVAMDDRSRMHVEARVDELDESTLR